MTREEFHKKRLAILEEARLFKESASWWQDQTNKIIQEVAREKKKNPYSARVAQLMQTVEHFVARADFEIANIAKLKKKIEALKIIKKKLFGLGSDDSKKKS